MIEVRLKSQQESYEGTILDGELYDNTLMVYDALLLCGEPVGHLNLISKTRRS